MEEDGLEYFKKINKEISGLNKTVTTLVKIDDTTINKIVKKIEEQVMSDMSSMTTEARGMS